MAHSIQQRRDPHAHPTSGVNAAIEIADKIHGGFDTAVGGSKKINSGVKLFSGVQAFRRYSWLKNAPIANVSGNFRGMVINPRLKAVYNVTLENAKRLEKYDHYLTLASMAIELAKAHGRIEQTISSSSMSAAEKTQRLLAIGSMSIFKAIGSPIPATAHLAAQALSRICNLSATTRRYSGTIGIADAAIQTSYEEMMDADNVVRFINTRLVFF